MRRQGNGGINDLRLSLAQLTKNTLNGVYGAGKYITALASGDLAEDGIVEMRRAVCKRCPSRVTKSAMLGVAASDWCGEPIHDGLDDAPPTCGCLLSGKTAVASERCPQGRW